MPIKFPQSLLYTVLISSLSAPVWAQDTQHLVQKGDTLTRLAKKYYDDYTLWPRIYEANKALLKDSNYLEAGWQLQIPEAKLETPAIVPLPAPSAPSAAPVSAAPAEPIPAPVTAVEPAKPAAPAEVSAPAPTVAPEPVVAPASAAPVEAPAPVTAAEPAKPAAPAEVSAPAPTVAPEPVAAPASATPAASAAAIPSADAVRAAIVAATVAVRQASEVGYEWRDSQRLLDEAQTALEQADFAKAMTLANTAKQQGDAGYQQSVREKSAGPRF